MLEFAPPVPVVGEGPVGETTEDGNEEVGETVTGPVVLLLPTLLEPLEPLTLLEAPDLEEEEPEPTVDKETVATPDEEAPDAVADVD